MKRSDSKINKGSTLGGALGIFLLLALMGTGSAIAAPGKPLISSTWTGYIAAEDTTLHATVDPNGSDTKYQFILSIPCPKAPPGGVSCEGIGSFFLGSEETIAAAAGPTSVYIRVSGGGYDLQPGTEYGWTIRTENSSGVEFSSDEEFVTARPPEIKGVSTSGVSDTSATLKAQIVPGVAGHLESESPAVAADYQFQLAADPSEYRPEIGCPDLSEFAGTSVQCLGPLLAEMSGGGEKAGSFQYESTDLPFQELFGSLELLESTPSGDFYGPPPAQGVSLDLGEVGRVLEPNTTYHYRVIAVLRLQGEDTIDWEAPPVYGPDQTFTTGPFGEVSKEEVPAGTGQTLEIPQLVSGPTTSQAGGKPPGPKKKRKCARKKHHGNGHRGLGHASSLGEHFRAGVRPRGCRSSH